jgi:hypothetical protein
VPIGGSVIKTPDQPTYTNGETVTLTAIPSNAPFNAWIGDVATRSNPVTLVMTNNRTVQACFAPILFVWAHLVNGDWDTPTNWNHNLAPGSNDMVSIPNGVTVTLNTPADCSDVFLQAANGALTLTGAGTLTIRRSLLWTAGTMAGSGRTIVEPGATLLVPGANSLSLNARTLDNSGTVLWTGAGGISINSGAVITNRAGALFHVENAPLFSSSAGANRFDNAGVFRKSAHSGTATIGGGVSFNNSGTVEIQTGTLQLGGGGTHSGSMEVSAGAALVLSAAHTGREFEHHGGRRVFGERRCGDAGRISQRHGQQHVQ